MEPAGPHVARPLRLLDEARDEGGAEEGGKRRDVEGGVEAAEMDAANSYSHVRAAGGSGARAEPDEAQGLVGAHVRTRFSRALSSLTRATLDVMVKAAATPCATLTRKTAT